MEHHGSLETQRRQPPLKSARGESRGGEELWLSCEGMGAEHLIAGLGLISPKSTTKDLWRSTLNSTLIYVFPVPKTRASF